MAPADVRVRHRTSGSAVRAAFRTGRRWFEESILGRWWAGLLDIQFLDRAVALAAKAFVAFLPAVLTVAAVAPERVQQNILATMQRRLGLSGASLEMVQTSLATGDPVSGTTSLLSIVLLLFYATTFTTAIQRVYLNAWHRPTVRDRVRELKGLAWLVGVISMLSLLNAVRRTFSGVVGTSVMVLVGFSVVVALWWVTSYAMLRGQVRWRVLLPPALAMAVGMSAYAVSAAVWVPRSMETNQEQFGFFGVSMTLVTWFVGFGFILVGSTTLGPVLATDTGAIGRLVRGGDDSLLRPGAPASEPAIGETGSPWRILPAARAEPEPVPAPR